ncbi:GntR family transcriptional regulator [uncultured Rhodospira sp.]|uniref:GntR family transcriptional regulator n=1 Tax=uncultured Rhodospira sp. TaxID=1936189 RepID=UPI00262A5784|nr:GntR family transcriptional regulator [uncultured Rhodospira sp.]
MDTDKADQQDSTRTGRVRAALEDEILDGRLPPGRRLDEASLARRFAVSRTPVREALRQLSTSGLVDLRPRQGAVVARLSLPRLFELIVVMADLESLCARLSARHMTPSERRVMLEACDDCERAVVENQGDEAFIAANGRFHDAIHAGSHNAVLIELASALCGRFQAYSRYSTAPPGFVAEAQADHWSVARAIVNGDADAAAEIMHRHVSAVGDMFAEALSLPPDE